MSTDLKYMNNNTEKRISPLLSDPSISQSPAEVDRLRLIEKGEVVPAVIHQDIKTEDIILEVNKLNLWYGNAQALYDIDFKVPRGKVTSLIGPSGCGKSTLLRCVNRINDLIDSVRIEGDMTIDGESIFSSGVDVIELRKRMGMVFQKPNPFR